LKDTISLKQKNWTHIASEGYTYTMSRAISAVFESGVFRPLEPVNLAEGTRAEVILSSPATESSTPNSVPLVNWPLGYFEHTAGALACEHFERPMQGELPQRDDW
jgi:hypothetical protein